jgi:tRNA-dihydrouridine synthase
MYLINMNIWFDLKKEKIEKSSKSGNSYVEPILVLAPMADVTDVAFRRVIAENGKPDVMWTEFVSADGLMLAPGDNPDD